MPLRGKPTAQTLPSGAIYSGQTPRAKPPEKRPTPVDASGQTPFCANRLPRKPRTFPSPNKLWGLAGQLSFRPIRNDILFFSSSFTTSKSYSQELTPF